MPPDKTIQLIYYWVISARPRIEERLLQKIDVRSDLLIGGRASTNLWTANSLGAAVTDL